MTTDPQADASSAAFISYLTAHLDRTAVRESEPDSVSDPDRGSDSALNSAPDVDPELDADPELDPDPLSESMVAARLEGIVAALSAPAAWSEPPDLRSAILSRVRAHAGNGTAPAKPPVRALSPEPVPEPEFEAATELAARELKAAPEPAAPELAAVIPLRPRWQRLAVALPLTAAAAVVVTLTVLGVQAALRPDPDQVFTALGAEGVRAEVTVTSKPSGFEITLEADDLPAAPAGSYYAAWLRRGPGPDDVVPIGTFHGRRVGDPIVLWSGVDPGEYGTFSVTLQRDGEPPLPNAPSARRVLVGTVDG